MRKGVAYRGWGVAATWGRGVGNAPRPKFMLYRGAPRDATMTGTGPCDTHPERD